MTPGSMDFRGSIMGPVGFKGPSRGLMGFRGPIEMTLRNQYVEDRRPFFLFWRSHHNPNKTVAFFREDLFFGGGDPIKSRQNRGIFPVRFGVYKTGDAQ